MNTGYWLPQGSILHEKYSIKKGLGQGGFAITYLAYDTMLQQNVAIKEYFPVRYAKRLSSHLSNVGNENSLTGNGLLSIISDKHGLSATRSGRKLFKRNAELFGGSKTTFWKV